MSTDIHNPVAVSDLAVQNNVSKLVAHANVNKDFVCLRSLVGLRGIGTCVCASKDTGRKHEVQKRHSGALWKRG